MRDRFYFSSRRFLPMLVVASATAVFAQSDAKKEEPVSFSFQVRPILAASCLPCHGMDEARRKAKLRLDLRTSALEKRAIVPGDPDKSELITRLTSKDPDDVMPPPDSHKTVSEPEREILRRWVKEGAPYEEHWAFVSPKKKPLPAASPGQPELAPIDALVRERLEREGLAPAPPTTPERLLRRATLDLTGLPPTIAELDSFLADSSPKAFEAAVDRLLGSKAFGERMATEWLDAARYADTYGRHEDADSPVWRYRDWVVNAFNANMPFDQFLIWQTAGDLLPNPTQDQLIATAFNRLVQQSNEAGSNEEEFRQEHVVDRIKTNGAAILGLTMECAKCHDHKYDPITMRDFYSLSAFLNNIDELGLFPRQTGAVPAPSLLIYTPEQQAQLDAVKEDINIAEAELTVLNASAKDRFAAWCKTNKRIKTLLPIAHYSFDEVGSKKVSARKSVIDSRHPKSKPAEIHRSPLSIEGREGYALRLSNDNYVELPGQVGNFHRSDPFSLAFWFRPMASQDRAVLVHRSRGGLDAASRGYEVILNQGQVEFSLSHFAPGNSIRIRTRLPIKVNEWAHITATYDGSSKADGMHLYINGKLVPVMVINDNLYRDIVYREEWGDFDGLRLAENNTPVIPLTIGWRYNDRGVKDGAFDEFKLFDDELTTPEIAKLVAKSVPEKEPSWWESLFGEKEAKDDLTKWFGVWQRDYDTPTENVRARLHALREMQEKIVNKADEIMIMREKAERRPTYVLTKGQFNHKEAQVTAATPAALPAMKPDWPRNRLGLAMWYVDPQNPLTARVAVNRLWSVFFGRGLVGTPEDFGTQGELPTQPALLDWLSVDFMEHGWDVKRLCKMIVLSATYQQSSMPASKDLLERDPQNKLLARGPRHRLSAEQIRDSALSVSGLLQPILGGPPVKPYQPAMLYEDSGVQAVYQQGKGPALFRRSLYTYWKRTLPPPNMLVFDAPTREVCRVRRDRTNTPLQALTLLNDPQFMEVCRVLSEKQVRCFPDNLAARAEEAFRLWTSRKPKPEEVQVLVKLVEDQRAYFSAHPDEAEAFRKHSGETAPDAKLPAIEVAATAQMHRALLGDDETLVKQ